MTMAFDIMNVLARQLGNVETGWSVGTFGAIAEFTRDAGEPADLQQTSEGIGVVTDKGGVRIVPRPNLRLIASESPTTESWSHRVAVCLPRESCAMGERTTLTEIGPDEDALRSRDRGDVLFDLALAACRSMPASGSAIPT
ncbi:hypothetical protein Q3C01_01575 [Bradyrhizobium sp. UFLA05-109]